MELLDSRCSKCKPKIHQCSGCQKADAQIRKRLLAERRAIRASVNAAGPATLNVESSKEAPAPAPAPAPALASASSPAPVFDDNQESPEGEVPECSNMETFTRKALGYVSPNVSAPALAPALAPAPAPALAPASSPARAAKPRLKNFRKQLSADGWTLLRTPRNGHCLFEAIAKGIQLCRPESAMTMKKLRSECSAKMMELNGEVPNWPTSLFHENVHGLRLTPLQIHRGEETTPVTLDEYCKLLGSNLYGGQEEIALMANMYKLQVNVFHSEFIEPQRYLQNPNLDPNHPDNAGNIIGCRI